MKKNKINYLLKEYKQFVASVPVYTNYLDKFQTFSASILKHTWSILLEHNTTFAWERRGNKREGAFTQKKLRENIDGLNLVVKVIKIKKDAPLVSQIHVYFHELAHLVCNHNNQDQNKYRLTNPQKEYVAEVVAQALLSSFLGGLKIDEVPKNNQWDPVNYISSWIKSTNFAEKKIEFMWEQINFSYQKISSVLLKNLEIDD